MKIISLGWGVQSFTLAAMSALGEIEKVDAVVHADTGHERSSTYEFAKKYTGWLEQRGIKVVTVKASHTGGINKYGGVVVPAYIENGGLISRQCTGNWKRVPVRRWLHANRNKEPVEQWLGISLDEFQRIKPSDVKYVTHRWTLIEMRMTRYDCMRWLEKHGLEIPSKSACVFCPFQNTNEWRGVKNNPKDWQDAVEVDKLIRDARLPGRLFVHVSRLPLEEVDLRNAEEKGQMSLWDNECFGICGV